MFGGTNGDKGKMEKRIEGKVQKKWEEIVIELSILVNTSECILKYILNIFNEFHQKKSKLLYGL